VIANKAFGFTPEYTLWGLDQQTLNEMFAENHYLTKRSEEDSKVQTDERGKYKWIEMETVDGKVKRIKKYIDLTAI